MPGTDAFQVEGLVMEVLANGTCRVQLSNGHQLLGFVAGRAKRNVVGLKPGARVRLQLSPYDLSEGRILLETEKI